MTPEAQRIAMAEFCGWTDIKECSCKKVPRGTHAASDREGHLPDYLTDLNAMHEAEKVLNNRDKIRYATCLFNEVLGAPVSVETANASRDGFFAHIHATAAQRAEAFLCTLGLWHETR